MTWVRRVRCGQSIVELLVALPIAIIAATAAAMLIVRLARVTRTQGAQLAAVRELRHAHAVLREDLEPLEARDLLTVNDSLIEIRAHLGLLQLCEQLSASAVAVAVPMRSDDAWVFGVRSGDVARSYGASADPAAVPIESHRRIAEPPLALGSGRCGVLSTAIARRFRLVFTDSQPPLAAGTPVLVQREVRYEHYRSGSSWWLGRRSRDGRNWEGIQPVAGPLLPPAQRGMEVTALGAGGVPVATDSVAAIRLLLRTPRRGPLSQAGGMSIPADSTMVDVVLRASVSRRTAP